MLVEEKGCGSLAEVVRVAKLTEQLNSESSGEFSVPIRFP